MLVKVISTAAVFGDKERLLETAMSDKTREHFLYRIWGRIDAKQEGTNPRYKRVDKETGEASDSKWTKFFGDMRAINSDNVVFEASACFIPAYIIGQFSEALESGQVHLSFAFDVFVRYNKDSATSYEYIAAPVRRAGDDDPIGKMTAELAPLPSGKAMPKLAAPSDDKKAIEGPGKKQ